MAKNPNYYLAARFRGRPDLHMTLCFYPEASDSALEVIIESVARFLPISLKPFVIFFDKPTLLGRFRNVYALSTEDEMPRNLLELRTEVPGSTKYKDFVPHVTCEKESKQLVLEVTSIAVMNRKIVIKDWEL